MSSAELKDLAKQQIKGNIGILFVITLLASVVVCAANMVPVIGSVGALLLAPALELALITIYLNLVDGYKPAVGDVFSELGNFWSAFKVKFLVGLFTALWSLLFVIPGIVMGLAYSQAMYILAENPGMGALEAINRSKAMMEGHKLELFVLNLSFIGWMLLSCITFGIALIWVIPYMQATMTNFYNSIKIYVEV